MEFDRTVEIDAPIDAVWALVADIPLVASCIPGVTGVEMTGDDRFACKLVQRVGSAKANFTLASVLEVDEPARRVVVDSDGRDRALGSTVSARQVMQFSTTDHGGTRVAIDATVQITGRLATFGHRVLATKAEQVTVDAVSNVEKLLKSRQSV